MGRLTLEQISQESKGGADATTSLNLSHRILSDVSCLSNFHNLERLDLSFNCLSSLEDLSSCVNLKWLSVMENKLETLKGVEGLSKLTILNAGKNMLRAMDEIKSLTSLRALILNDNKIPSICKLDHLSFLNTLGSTSMPKILNRLPSSLGKSRSTIIGHNAYNWNIILRGFLEGNAPNKVILAYALMRRKRVKVDSFTILFVIKACGVIMQKVLGKQVHAQVTKLGFQQEVVTQTAILQMYGLFGDIEAADKLFGETPKRDIVQWNALLAMYSQRNRPYSTIKVAQRMVSESVRPNEVTVVSIISACSHLKALAEGKQWHGYIIKHLAVLDTFVHNALVNMYAICGCLSDAEKIFKNLGNKNEVSWTTMINAYGASGYLKEALELFKKMEAVGETPDEVTMLAVVSICAKLGRFDLGEWIDDYIKRFGLYENIHIANALIDMHSKCGRIEKSCRIFGKMTRRTLITWTAMIRGLAMHGHGRVALTRFLQMQMKGFRPDEVAFLSMINACSHAGLVEEGKHFFMSMVEVHGIKPWMEHYGSMVDLLCRAGLLNEAFDFVMSMHLKPDIIIWRTLIGACRDQGSISLTRQILDYVIELEPKDSGNYILKSNLHAMMGNWDNVENLRSSMRCKGVIKTQPALSYIY